MNIGVDLGGTNIRVAVIDDNGSIIEELGCSTEVRNGPHRAIEKIIVMIQGLQARHAVQAVGIGAPGPLDAKNGIIIEPPNLPGWQNIELTKTIASAVDLPVYLENDANAAALAEALIGAGKKADSVFYITVSTGVGGGYVYDGKVISGAQGNCGEIGNMIVDPHAIGAPNLNKGALEALASGTAIGRKAESVFGPGHGAKEVFLLAKEGNQEAAAIIDEALNYLAIGIANIVHTLNPEVIVLGGGVMKSKDLMLDPLKGKVLPLLYPSLRPHLKVELASLDQKAGVVGAAMVPGQYL
ncbi:ROK family protein [Metabacillus idriensis]|uniref:ROK family protein n=1 Tax=Metabacillus idriensis TaxID=324768 RepID=UPI003D27A89D